MDDEEIYIRKLEAGLYTLQVCFAVIVNLCDFTMDIANCRISDFNFALEPMNL